MSFTKHVITELKVSWKSLPGSLAISKSIVAFAVSCQIFGCVKTTMQDNILQ